MCIARCVYTCTQPVCMYAYVCGLGHTYVVCTCMSACVPVCACTCLYMCVWARHSHPVGTHFRQLRGIILKAHSPARPPVAPERRLDSTPWHSMSPVRPECPSPTSPLGVLSQQLCSPHTGLTLPAVYTIPCPTDHVFAGCQASLLQDTYSLIPMMALKAALSLPILQMGTLRFTQVE